MIFSKTPILIATSAVLVLGACTDPGQLNDPSNPNRNRDLGVLLGAATGAALGQIFGGNTEATVAGAAIGAEEDEPLAAQARSVIEAADVRSDA